jgi:hypothetical protein
MNKDIQYYEIYSVIGVTCCDVLIEITLTEMNNFKRKTKMLLCLKPTIHFYLSSSRGKDNSEWFTVPYNKKITFSLSLSLSVNEQ